MKSGYVFTFSPESIMKKILLFGAGKSATVLIQYLAEQAEINGWQLTVVDANASLLQSRLQQHPMARGISFDIHDENLRRQQITESDLVISLLPPALHLMVAQDCLQSGKHLLTASYVDPQIRAMAKEIEAKGILFLCEMGLDPGIDHMSAQKIISEIKAEGGQIHSFISHCGGLVAPESDDNPWHYKISWNPRNVVLAGKAGAVYLQEGKEISLGYEELFREKRFTLVPGLEPLCWYPNRDSVSYKATYGLDDCPTFIRGTLRHPDFMYGWKNLLELQLTDETPRYDSEGKSLKELFKQHLDSVGFDKWLEQRLHDQFSYTKKILTELVNLTEREQEAASKGIQTDEEFMMVNEEGGLQEVDIEDLKLNAAAALADRMHDAKLTLKQLFFLGLDDAATMVNNGKCSAADILQVALEKKLALSENDRDMVVMKHELEYEFGGSQFRHNSTLVVKGENNQHTAMASTVGLPLGIAARLILDGTIQCRGLQIPTSKEIYEPVLEVLEKKGIRFVEERVELK